MYEDESEDPIWRDYCLQHLEALYDHVANRQVIVDTLLSAVRKGDNPYAGTALMAVDRLVQEHPDLGPVSASLRKVRQTWVVADEKDEERLIVAFQMAASKRDSSILPKARIVAVDPNVLARVRMSAIGVLGELGTEDDMPLIESLLKEKDTRIRNAAKYGLNRLKKKRP